MIKSIRTAFLSFVKSFVLRYFFLNTIKTAKEKHSPFLDGGGGKLNHSSVKAQLIQKNIPFYPNTIV